MNASISRGFCLVALLGGLLAADPRGTTAARADTAPSGAPHAASFELDGGIAVDSATHLAWQRCSVGQRWVGDGCVGVIRQMSWQDAKRLEKDGWRLPSREELMSVVRPSDEVAIDTQAFPDMELNKLWYWSGTSSDSSAWYVAFGGGSAHLGAQSDRNSVRLVKAR